MAQSQLDLTGLVQSAGSTPASAPVVSGGLDLTGLVTTPASDPRSALGRLVDRLNTPLVPQIATGARAIAEPLAQPGLNDSPWWARVKGFTAGATEGAGDVAASFTSPLGLAAWLLKAREQGARHEAQRSG